MSEKKLSPKEQRFVDEYLVDLNAAHAAQRAGYSERTARQIGYELLGREPVAAAVQAGIKLRADRTLVRQDNVLRELAALSFYDAGELGAFEVSKPQDIARLPEMLRRCIVGWSWDRNGNFTLKLADKTPNLTLAMRHLGMVNDKLILERPKVRIRDLTGRKGTPK
jgi:phage terminase small subunit